MIQQRTWVRKGKDNEYGYGMVNAGEAVYVKAQDTDTTPPGSISNLEASSVGDTWIRWDWENPQDTDFGYTMLFLNGTWICLLYTSPSPRD